MRSLTENPARLATVYACMGALTASYLTLNGVPELLILGLTWPVAIITLVRQ